MNYWNADGLVLAARAHGESGLVLTLLTEQHGRVVGYVPGGQGRARRGGLGAGARVTAEWRARVADQMGTFVVEAGAQPAGVLMDDGMRLAALQAACALCDAALPEREAHPGLYHGMSALMDQLADDMWGVAYVAWEIAFMKELGYALDFTRCAGGGAVDNLRYMSPKSGVAVSEEMGLIYKAKMLELPEFLRFNPDLDVLGTLADVDVGLRLTGYFLEHWVFNHHRGGVPDARLVLGNRVARACERDVVQVA
jgi:DNA repair protein RecO (recombination protein O)